MKRLKRCPSDLISQLPVTDCKTARQENLRIHAPVVLDMLRACAAGFAKVAGLGNSSSFTVWVLQSKNTSDQVTSTFSKRMQTLICCLCQSEMLDWQFFPLAETFVNEESAACVIVFRFPNSTTPLYPAATC